jgi:hypothetical protein
MNELCSVKKTQELMDAGCKSVADLRSRKFSPMLSHKQQVFLKYLDHLGKPMTREEAEMIAVSSDKESIMRSSTHVFR